MKLSDRAVRFGLKPVAFLASLGPLAYLIWAALTGNLSANPLADLTNETGVWTLRFICLTLAITPLRKWTGWNTLVKFRRMAGLYAFFYGSLHLLTYAIVDRFAGLDQAPGWVEAISAGHVPGPATDEHRRRRTVPYAVKLAAGALLPRPLRRPQVSRPLRTDCVCRRCHNHDTLVSWLPQRRHSIQAGAARPWAGAPRGRLGRCDGVSRRCRS